MVGVEAAVGYALAYLGRKLRQAAGRTVDDGADRLVDSAAESLLAVVSRAVGDDDELRRAARRTAEGPEAAAARAPEPIVRAVADAVAARPEFAAALEQAVDRVEAAGAGRAGRAGRSSRSGRVSAAGDGVAAAGGVGLWAQGGSVAALRTGDVHLGNPPVPGPPQT